MTLEVVEGETAQQFDEDADPAIADDNTQSDGDDNVSASSVVCERIVDGSNVLAPGEETTGPVAIGVEIEPEIVVDLENPMPPTPQLQAAFTSFAVKKESLDEDLGITFGESDGELEICSINNEDGLFAESRFRKGDKVRSINNVRCSAWEPEKAIQRLKDEIGIVTIIVQNPNGDPSLVESTIRKPTSNSKVGIGFRMVNHILTIGLINPSGYFATSVLNIGDWVVSVNEIPCIHASPEDVVTLVKTTSDKVSIVARRQFETGLVVSRYSFRSTCSNLSQTSRLLSAIDHGSNYGISRFTWFILFCFIVTALFTIFGMHRDEDDS